MAFDRTFGFVFTNFSKHQYAWTADGITFNGTVTGIDSIKRDCSIVIYQAQEAPEAPMRYFVRACGKIDELTLAGEVTGVLNRVAKVSMFCLFRSTQLPWVYLNNSSKFPRNHKARSFLGTFVRWILQESL